jgi:outer membrane protein insertion porin family
MLHVILAALLLQQAPAASDSRLASVQVKGTRRYTPEEVTRLTGLQIGKPIAAADLNAAANRLAGTGLFNSVRFSYTTGRAFSVIFEVEEAQWSMPIVLDNFVAVPDDQLIAAVRAEVPSFDGTSAPINQGAADFIVSALQNVMKAKGLPGQVTYTAQMDMYGRNPRYLFIVKDPSPKVCALHASGASAIAEKELLAPLDAVRGGDYSRFFLETASRGTLLDMYHRKGHWAARFDTPRPVLNECDGVAVTLRVTEGTAYTWDRAEWTGNQTMTADTLNTALAMKPGELADGGKIDSGLRDVHRLYGKSGYIAERATFETRLDDATHKAVFAFSVQEGPQFHMGTVQVEGVRESDAAALVKKWRLKPGDVYDASYERQFQVEELGTLRTSTGARPNLQTEVDQAQHVVNVKIVFK